MVLLTAAGWTDPLFQGLAPEQRIMQMHEDSFDLPQESVLLMLNETRHSGLVHRSMGSKHHAETVERRVLSEVDAYFDAGADFCRTITDRWLDLIDATRGKHSS